MRAVATLREVYDACLVASGILVALVAAWPFERLGRRFADRLIRSLRGVSP